MINMKKIPTLCERIFENHKVVGYNPDNITPGCECVLKGETVATVKLDGSCCYISPNGTFYKRYDARVDANGKLKKPLPEGAIPCCDPDPITGHWPHWLECDVNKKEDKWFIEAFNNCNFKDIVGRKVNRCTLEAIGPHFQGNPYNLEEDILEPHGIRRIEELSYKEISVDLLKEYLETHEIEGIVFWSFEVGEIGRNIRVLRLVEPICKIKRSDFGLKWPV